ncbi:3-deoxy-7-phosphoheptulonate synthase [Saccharothrix sp. 6-C]|uniref:3-deoxy-7-phosphoheptulonate synthase n=1 Tax=Saccharothrix sp. 6-C TaxID=2781735 RepID=UPI0019170961|nr:3-deoxy-7-phosphoheptulonate synthase [Saccharothrix sp. 6-C]QQQ79549.1 3-deoxy-7-phosphoheptulonate synthase [Saccharothrix sp. 6-C]
MAKYLALTNDRVTEEHLHDLITSIGGLGGDVEVRQSGARLLLIAEALAAEGLEAALTACEHVRTVVDADLPHPLAGPVADGGRTVVRVAGVAFGAGRPVLIAGPCSAENPQVLLETAKSVRDAGAAMLRVGMFKPRTSPYSFHGLGREGIALLSGVRDEIGLPVVTEVMSVRDIDLVAGVADMVQVGARNMQNYSLLVELGRAGVPVLLKRGLAATVSEWLNAAEYLLANGASDVVLCERGIRTFDRTTRFTLDLNAVPVVKERSHLPVIVDPSHGTGVARYVGPMSAAALAAGSDGLIIEVHPDPAVALSDGDQSLDFDEFAALATRLRRICSALGTGLEPAPGLAPARP